MERRSFIKASASTVAATTLLAGCIDEDEGGVSDGNTVTGSADNKNSETKQKNTSKPPSQTTATTTETKGLAILNHETEEGEYENTIIAGQVANRSGTSLAYAEIKAVYYDSEDVRIGEGLWNASEVSKGQKMEFEIGITIDGDESMDHYELETSVTESY